VSVPSTRALSSPRRRCERPGAKHPPSRKGRSSPGCQRAFKRRRCRRPVGALRRELVFVSDTNSGALQVLPQDFAARGSPRSSLGFRKLDPATKSAESDRMTGFCESSAIRLAERRRLARMTSLMARIRKSLRIGKKAYVLNWPRTQVPARARQPTNARCARSEEL
jgi:hypothetical protein